MRVVIAGAGNVGQAIASELIDEGHTVVLIEEEPRALDSAKKRLPDAEFVLADVTEIRNLTPAHLETADAAVAATGEDQVNLVFSLMASQEFGVPRIVARVNNPRNAWLFDEDWGIDAAVSTSSLLASAALEAVGSGDLVRLQPLQGGAVFVCSVTISDTSPVLDRTVAQLGLPMGASVTAIVREGVVVPPDPDQVVGIKDELILVVEASVEIDVDRLLTGG